MTKTIQIQLLSYLMIFICTTAQAEESRSCDLLFNLGLFEEAKPRCQQDATSGDSQAALYMAAIFTATGNPEDAFTWLNKAHRMGQPEATYNLAYAHEKGIGTPKDLQTSTALYTEAAEAGHPTAQHTLAGILASSGTEGRAEAFLWYEKAAQQDYLPAQIKAAQYLLEKNKQAQAISWLEKAQKAGSSNAMYLLGIAYSQTDPPLSLHWYQQALDQGNPYAAHNLANKYMTGAGVETDYDKALELANFAEAKGVEKSSLLKKAILARINQNNTGSSPPVTRSIARIQKAKPVLKQEQEQEQEQESNPITRSRDWVFTQPDSHFVIQLGSFGIKKNAERYITNNQLEKNTFYYLSTHRAKPVHIVLMGHYTSRSFANQALRQLSPKLRAGGAFIKSYKSIKRKRRY
ncbi:MAG: SPOR domain-containing protein [Pontibacterium sp.]